MRLGLKRLLLVLLGMGLINPVWAESRLVSLKPNITDLLFEMGVGSQVVGVTTFCSLPASASSVPRVADYGHVDIEKLLTIKPTVVIASQENSLKRDVEFMTSHGIDVKLLSFSRLEDTYQSIQKLGEWLQKPDEARRIIQKIKSTLQVSAVKGSPPRVLMVVGRHPLVVVGSGNFLNDLLTELKVINIAGNSRIRYPTFSTEQLLAARPEIILDLVMGTETTTIEEARRFYAPFQSLPALKAGRIHFLDINDFHPSGRLTVGIEKMGRCLL